MDAAVFRSNEQWESWIWTELLAFDNTLPDYGVKAYLESSGHLPFGISLLLMSPDFLLRHEWNGDALIPDDAASRQGHLTNGKQLRQDWNQRQLKELVCELHKYDIKVIFSIFCNDLNEVFHREFIREFCDVPGFNPLSALKDGRDAGKLFEQKLEQVIIDYGFDGWHGGDTIACPWDISHICYGSDQLFDRFREQYGIADVPATMLTVGDDWSEQRKRLKWLISSYKKEWSEFLLDGWHRFWRGCIDTVHRLNGLVVVNSPNTKLVFGALQYMALDYRKLDEMGIDRLVVETNTTSAALLWHKRDYLHEFSAVMAEMTAAMPHTGIIMMPCMQDTVECYDAIAHAPGMFERDFMILAAQQIIRGGRCRKCADGVMICLGDALEKHHWKTINTLLNRTGNIRVESSGELVWLADAASFDLLVDDHWKNGTWSPAYQTGKLKEFSSVDISCITVPDELENITVPLFVPNFHLLSNDLQRKLLGSGKALVLTGDLAGMELPESASGVCLQGQGDFIMGCVLVNWKNTVPGIKQILHRESKPFDPAESFSLYTACYPRMDIPDEFWKAAAAEIRKALGKTALKDAGESVQLLCQHTVEGSKRYIVFSREWFYQRFYLEPECVPAEIATQSTFPVFPVRVSDGYVASTDDIPLKPHVPPQGCCVFEIYGR